MSDITLLPSAKVPLIYPDTNGMTTEWYRFFWNIYGFTGTGVVPVNKGGTGLDTIGDHQLIIGNANNVFEPASLSSASIAITYPAGFVNLELGTSGVTPGTYGSASQVGVFTVNQYGVLTAASNTSIGIDASQIISGTLPVVRGGTSATTLTGYVKGNGTSAFTASATVPTTDLSGTITNAQLANSTISGVALGGNLFNLTAGTGVSFSAGTTYNGSTAITITATGSGGTVTSVTGTAPVVSSGGTTPAISMAAATGSVNGYLTSTDWTTFNGKYSVGGALGTPSSGTVTNLTGTASININGTVGATTANTGAFTTLTTSGGATIQGLTLGKGGGTVATNTAFGLSAIASGSTTGALLTAVGWNAMALNAITANSSSAFGARSLYSLTSGAQNTGIGEEALYSVSIGQNNAALGFASGYGITSGSYNVIIGGYQGSAAPISATGSNYVVLSDGQANIKLVCFPTGGVSIGNTTDPGATNLSVTGSGTFAGSTQQRVIIQNTTASSTGYVELKPNTGSSGQVGIGNSSWSNASYPAITAGGAYLYSPLALGLISESTYPIIFQTNNAERMRIFSTGGVSIGNTTDKGAASLNVSGLIFPQQATTAGAPAYVKGAIYFDTTLNKLRVGGATAWETITSV